MTRPVTVARRWSSRRSISPNASTADFIAHEFQSRRPSRHGARLHPASEL